VPGQIQAGGPGFHRADAVLPSIAGHEITARIPNKRDAELVHQLEHVAPEAVLVGKRMVGLVDAAVDAPAQVLDERPEHSPVDGATTNAGSSVNEALSMAQHRDAERV
jgi:hypothetical protein